MSEALKDADERPKATRLDWIKFWFSTHKLLTALIAVAVPYVGVNVVNDVSKILPTVQHEQIEAVPEVTEHAEVEAHLHPYAFDDHAHVQKFKLPKHDHLAKSCACGAEVNAHLEDLHGL